MSKKYKKPLTILQKSELDLLKTSEQEKFLVESTENQKVFDILDDSFKVFYETLQNQIRSLENESHKDIVPEEFINYKKQKLYLDYLIIPVYLDNLTEHGLEANCEIIENFGRANEIKVIEDFLSNKEKRIESLKAEQRAFEGEHHTNPVEFVNPNSEEDSKNYKKIPIKLKFSELQKLRVVPCTEILDKFDKVQAGEYGEIVDILDEDFKKLRDDLENPQNFFIADSETENNQIESLKEKLNDIISFYIENLTISGVKNYFEKTETFKKILSVKKIENLTPQPKNEQVAETSNAELPILNENLVAEEIADNGSKDGSLNHYESYDKSQIHDFQSLKNKAFPQHINFLKKLIQKKEVVDILRDDFQNFYKNNSDKNCKTLLNQLIFFYLQKKLETLTPYQVKHLKEFAQNNDIEMIKNFFISKEKKIYTDITEIFPTANEKEVSDMLDILSEKNLMNQWMNTVDKSVITGKESFLINYAFEKRDNNILNFLLKENLLIGNIKKMDINVLRKHGRDLSICAFSCMNEDLVKFLAEKQLLVSGNIFTNTQHHPNDDLDENSVKKNSLEFMKNMVTKGHISLLSLADDQTFANLFKVLLNFCPSFWQSIKIPHNYKFDITKQPNSSLQLVEYLEDIQKILEGDISTLEPPFRYDYLTTDLRSVRKLFERGLIDLSYLEDSMTEVTPLHTIIGQVSIGSDAREKVKKYMAEQDLYTRIEKAAKAGNIYLLNSICSKNPKIFHETFNNHYKQFATMLKQGINEVLKSRDIKKVNNKIDIKLMLENKINSNEDLEKLLEKPDLLSRIIEYIYENLLSHIGLKSTFQIHATNISEAFLIDNNLSTIPKNLGQPEQKTTSKLIS